MKWRTPPNSEDNFYSHNFEPKIKIVDFRASCYTLKYIAIDLKIKIIERQATKE